MPDDLYGCGVRELAQVNVAVMRASLDDPVMARFADAFDPIARLADEAPGFLWRLRTPSGHTTLVIESPQGVEHLVVNVSVWTDYASLHAFAYRSAHGALLRQRARWFLPTPQASTALWWVRPGQRPTIHQAFRRLNHLREHGPTPQAFSLLQQFDPLGRPIERPGPSSPRPTKSRRST
jgi:hypothetical protein